MVKDGQQTYIPLKLLVEDMRPDAQNILEASERQLDRIQNFFPRIDGKISTLFAIVTGQIAVAAINLDAENLKSIWIWLPGIAYSVLTLMSMHYLYDATHPRLDGGKGSLIYFAEIAKMEESEFKKNYCGLNETEYLDQISSQIWRNSQIVDEKFSNLKSATRAIMLATIPWATMIVGAAILAKKVPMLP